MSEDKDIAALRSQIDELECRLDIYHEQLAAVVKQRDEFSLKATLGILHVIAFTVCFYGAYLVFQYRLELTAWYWTLLAFLIGFVAAGFAVHWTEKLAGKDKGQLWTLPEWTRK